MKKLLVLLLLFSCKLFATDPYPRNNAIDIQHYLFQLELNDRDNNIVGKASITIRFRQPVREFGLDLIGKKKDEFGMTVKSVSCEGKIVQFVHEYNRLNIQVPSGVGAGALKIFTIEYEGIPADGLIIGQNKYGDRTFFGDNWPDRARNWLPTIDHPYDKAQCDFVITAPERYQVVANGEQIEESSLLGNRKLTHWRESVPISTKLMVIGVAQFAVQKSGEVNGVPVSTWVFRQDREAGFYDFSPAPKVLRYFSEAIGPYSYEKLANVQSKTKFGGMENASCIFYFENSVTGKSERESLIAHEIAHQWFGDSATEADWYHVWLSEGFATYFASLYLEQAYGNERLLDEMRKDRDQVIEFSKRKSTPVIDTTYTDMTRVLNTNTYQKAGWFLHMLRLQVGDSVFFQGVRRYYERFRNSNALTDDFRKAIEAESGQNLASFFNQWLRQPGHPIVSGNWAYNASTQKVELNLHQEQAVPFRFTLEIEMVDANGGSEVFPVAMDGKSLKTSISMQSRPVSATLDPNVKLLFEGHLTAK